MGNIKKKCRLCEQFFNEEEMSEEHYPAHSIGNDDIIALDFTKYVDTLMGENEEFKSFVNCQKEMGKDIKHSSNIYFDNYLSKSLFPKGRTARTLCRKCNTFIGKYDEAYKKYYMIDGNPKKIKGFQRQTRLFIIKAVFAKFLSIPETQDMDFDFLDFIRNDSMEEYHGNWMIYFVKRDMSTDLMGLKDIQTGKIDWNGDGEKLVYEFSDDKFIYNLLNFEKHSEFEMNCIFDILRNNYSVVEGIHNGRGSYHENIGLSRLFSQIPQ